MKEDERAQQLTFDQTLERLRSIVQRLEQGNISLEQSLVAFEEGIRLSRWGGEILDDAERKLETLVKGEGGDRAVPFSPDAPGGKGDGAP